MRLSRFFLGGWWVDVDFLDSNGNAWAPARPAGGRRMPPPVMLSDADYDVVLPARSSVTVTLDLMPQTQLKKQNLWFGPSKPDVLLYEGHSTIPTKSLDPPSWSLSRDTSGKGEVKVIW